jgi:hypothetical protein
MATNFPPGGLADSGDALHSVRRIPVGDISKAQARTSAIGNPRNTRTMTNRVAHPGIWRKGKVEAAIWIRSQPTTA